MRVGGLGWPHLAPFWLHEWYQFSITLNTSNRGDELLLRLISNLSNSLKEQANMLEQHEHK